MVIGMHRHSEKGSQNTISKITRRKIIETLTSASWWGDLDEIDFLNRLYDLDGMPSTDGRYPDAKGDIIQHRVANFDWDDSWVFSDERFGLYDGPHETFLRFLAETLHPEVRSNSDQVLQLMRDINSHLMRDGWELIPVDELSGYPIYRWKQRDKSLTKVPEGFPLELEPLIRTLAEVMKHRGQARELAILANSSFHLEQVSYDNWNGGMRGWGLTCQVEASLYARLTAEERTDCEEIIKQVTAESFRQFTNDFLEQVVLIPMARSSGDWRIYANRWLSGEGVNNQGRVRSDNIASLECDGLLFRSEPEINLYRALKHSGVTFAPLPVFLRGGTTYARLEPDFVVLKDGCVLVIEVDGDTYHRETPADAHKRLLPLDHEGAKIERVTAGECDTPEKAQLCAQRLLQVIEGIVRRR
ncbi:MAG TPA: hypothetical protein VGC66_09570 [Pyrinomonadaceae bacterium]|jgi:hypothetical protein